MNLKEFAALKAGDKIDNHFTGGQGEVVEATDKGVLVRWHPLTTPRTYGVNTTAWMHWSKAEPASPDELLTALGSKAPKECPNGGPCTSERCEAADQCLGGTKEQYSAIAKA